MRIALSPALVAIVLFSCSSGKDQAPKLHEAVSSLYDRSLKPFYHGVASGDPLQDRVIIWTRVTPDDSVMRIPVKWFVATDTNFTELVRTDTTSATAVHDYTVKVDVTGLQPATKYFYRFEALGKTSLTGETKTFPSGHTDSLKLAAVSCANWEFGYFNAYARLAERDLDAVLHLGDYIYEYATGKYGNPKSGRTNIPEHEVVTLADYRLRYSQYHLDEGLRKVRQKHPLIAIWDDHEVANDVYTEGAQNHQPEEGDFKTRKRAAQQAYHEWIPIRDGEKHYRSFAVGDLADIIMLDERLEGRVKPFDSASDPNLKKIYHSMLGAKQLEWFEKKLKEGKRWKIVGNQVLFSEVSQKYVDANANQSLDSWSGYPLERKRIADFIESSKIPDVILLSGDTHSSWALEATLDPTRYNAKTSSGTVAVELGVTSISSGNSNEYMTDDQVLVREKNFLRSNAHLKYTNHRDHGYLLLTVFPDHAKAEWYRVNTVLTVNPGEHRDTIFTFARGSHTLK